MTYTVGGGWSLGEDGYYYYDKPVAAGKATDILFDTVTFAPQMGNEFNNTPVQQPPQQAPAQAMPQPGTPDMASAMNPPQTNNQSAFTQPTPQTANPAQAQPQQAAQPVNPNPTGFQGSESQGIHYNPGDMGRNY